MQFEKMVLVLKIKADEYCAKCWGNILKNCYALGGKGALMADASGILRDVLKKLVLLPIFNKTYRWYSNRN